jgi:hypothetical protein
MGVRRDLNPDVALDVIQEPICFQGVVDDPFPILSELIDLDLEEKDLAAAPDDEGLLIDQVHVSEVLVIDFLFVKTQLVFVLGVVCVGIHLDWDPERVALTIEAVYLIVVAIVVTLLGEVFLVAFQLD